MDREQIEELSRKVAEDTARKTVAAVRAEIKINKSELSGLVAVAVQETLIQLGINFHEPIEMQRDFQHLRQWRLVNEDIKGKAITGLLAVIATGALTLIIMGFIQWVKMHNGD